MGGAQILETTVYAGFVSRTLAKLIDFLFLFLCVLPFDLLLHTPLVVKRAGEADRHPLLGIMILSGLWFFYEAITESSSRQATFGKRFIGIVVTDTTGQRITFSRAAARWLIQWISWYSAGLVFLMVLFTRRKQALHDIVADTLVLPGTL